MAHDDVVANATVVSDVGMSQQGAIIANSRCGAILGPAVYAHELANGIAIADLRMCDCPGDMLLVLRLDAQCHKRKDIALGTDAGVLGHDHM